MIEIATALSSLANGRRKLHQQRALVDVEDFAAVLPKIYKLARLTKGSIEL
jgi:hypothetical protein